MRYQLKIPWGHRAETIKRLRASGVIVSDSGREAWAKSAAGEKELNDLAARGWAREKKHEQ